MDPRSLAEQIVRGVGGPGNIRSIGRCTTRLRMVLVDRGLADREAVRALPGVMSTVERGGQFQVVIGHEVAPVATQVRVIVTETGGRQDLTDAPAPMSVVDRVFDLLAGTFQPLLWPLVGAGLVRTMLSLAVRFGWVDQGSGTWAVWAAAGSGFFLLLPVFVGITAAGKLGANRYVGGAIGAALVSGTLLQLGQPGTESTFLGIPMTVVDYGSSVFPAILAAVGLAWLEGWLRRLLPKDLHLVLVPAVCLAVLVPATVLLFGPVGTFVGDRLADAVVALNAWSPVITGALYAMGFLFLVMLGLHWAIVPVTLTVLAEQGSEPLAAYMGAYNFAVFGVALGVFLRSRDAALRQLGLSGLITGLLAGISEPTVYGILLRYRRALVIMLVAAGAGGALLGLGRVQATAVAFSNLFTIPAFSPVGGYLLGIGVAFALGAAGVTVLGFGEGAGARPVPDAQAHLTTANPSGAPTTGPGSAPSSELPESRRQEPAHPAAVAAGASQPGPAAAAPGTGTGREPAESLVLTTPLPGQVVPLGELSDPVFARGLLGPGVAIRPSSGLVRSPARGRISTIARARHAIGITTDEGAEILIHIGIDTVHLAGRHMDVLVTQGQRVEGGQPIAHVEIGALTAEGHDATTPMVVTNAAAFGALRIVAPSEVVASGDALLELQVHPTASRTGRTPVTTPDGRLAGPPA